jgi:hypothetical protein
MLNRNPKARITIPEMKKHPFFASINWTKLMAREVPPPVKLSLDDDDMPTETANEEEQFLNQQFEKPTIELFKDKDYDKQNRTLNRVK